jgi:hypothetical protein
MSNVESGEPLSVCSGCKKEVDLDLCWCGNLYEDHGLGLEEHRFVPMGCVCGVPKPSPDLPDDADDDL